MITPLGRTLSPLAVAAGAPAWTPESIADLALWWDADRADTISATGTTLHSWTDRKNGLVLQPNAGTPLYLAAGAPNGKPAVRFGASGVASLRSGAAFGVSAQRTYHMVLERVGSAVGSWETFILQDSDPYIQFYGINPNWYMYPTAGSLNFNLGLTAHLVSWSIGASSASLYVDGALVGSLSGAVFSTSPLNSLWWIGGYTSIYCMNGHVMEVLVTGSASDQAAIDRVNNYAKAKWGTP